MNIASQDINNVDCCHGDGQQPATNYPTLIAKALLERSTYIILKRGFLGAIEDSLSRKETELDADNKNMIWTIVSIVLGLFILIILLRFLFGLI